MSERLTYEHNQADEYEYDGFTGDAQTGDSEGGAAADQRAIFTNVGGGVGGTGAHGALPEVDADERPGTVGGAELGAGTAEGATGDDALLAVDGGDLVLLVAHNQGEADVVPAEIADASLEVVHSRSRFRADHESIVVAHREVLRARIQQLIEMINAVDRQTRASRITIEL